MRETRIGLRFEGDNYSSPREKVKFAEVEDILKSGIICSKEIVNYLYEIDRTEQIKKRSNIQIAAQKRISEINMNAAREKYENHLAELQEKLQMEEEKINLEIQRFKLEVEERIQRESLTFDACMKKSKILMDLILDEKKQIDELDSISKEYLDRYSSDFNTDFRIRYNNICDIKMKCLERINKLFNEIS